MRIWHEELIPDLCQKHLCAMWRESLGCYKIITENKKGYRNHPAVKEFIGFANILWIRLGMVRKEMINRGYNPKLMPSTPDLSLCGTFEAYKRGQWQTLEEQKQILRDKGCKCKLYGKKKDV